MTRLELRDRVVDFLTLGEYGYEERVHAAHPCRDLDLIRLRAEGPFDWSRDRDLFPARHPAYVGRGRGVELQREVGA